VLTPNRGNLDADIIVDASFVRSLKQEYRTLVQPNQSQRGLPYPSCLGSAISAPMTCAGGIREQGNLIQIGIRLMIYAMGWNLLQFEIGSLALSLQNTMPSSEETKEYIHEYLRSIIAHEGTHLGLRHNFVAAPC